MLTITLAAADLSYLLEQVLVVGVVASAHRSDRRMALG